VTVSEPSAATDSAAEAVARAFVEARRQARSLPAFPGPLPTAMAQAYATQEKAIGLYGERIVGWKVGLIAEPLRAKLGAERLAGPIFANSLSAATPGQVARFPIFAGGFAAVEGEFVLRLGADAPAGKANWTADEALENADALFIGVETAGSPLATINELGPTVVASDFGNNFGLILGREVPDWRKELAGMTCETFVEGVSVGTGTPASLPGGPGAALAFLLNNLAGRGRPGRAGDLVSTGAVTGIHDIGVGQSARVNFGAFGDILCQAEMARPEPA
jgi:2-keto-4-pentenoate hydratase